MSLYASREGALYQSYDNYAGAQGFYEPEQQGGGMPQPPAGLQTTGMEQYAQVVDSFLSTFDCVRMRV
eukprot:1898373-Rhodomonas_salina.1